MGVVERSAFACLTFVMLDKGNAFNIPLDWDVDNLVYVIGGWVVLKTLMGWRRIRDVDAAVMRLSMVGIMGSLVSVLSGAAVGGLMYRFVDF